MTCSDLNSLTPGAFLVQSSGSAWTFACAGIKTSAAEVRWYCFEDDRNEVEVSSLHMGLQGWGFRVLKAPNMGTKNFMRH